MPEAYYFAPDAEQRWVWLMPGAVMATILWLLASLGFKYYVAAWGRYTETYGLIGAVMHPAPSAAIDAMLDSLRLFGLGYSWGGFESLAISCDPQLQSRQHCGSYAGPLLRFHIGLESVDDLIADLRQGLDRIAAE